MNNGAAKDKQEEKQYPEAQTQILVIRTLLFEI
jgi:hypothetical protein